jgi:hypothetical protein
MLDRRIAVAPMMDWTDGGEAARQIRDLGGCKNRGSFLVATDGRRDRACFRESAFVAWAP